MPAQEWGAPSLYQLYPFSNQKHQLKVTEMLVTVESGSLREQLCLHALKYPEYEVLTIFGIKCLQYCRKIGLLISLFT